MSFILDPKALHEAVIGYDEARCAVHIAAGNGPCEPMSPRNRETITPMIAEAIRRYLKAVG